MSDFTPISAALGGALIGAAATAMLLFNGRVAGISGILGGVLRPERGDTMWRVVFVLGLFVGGVVFGALRPSSFDATASPHLAIAIAAGLLVGAGVQLSNGCTSGHGVCGVSRLSKRSLAATMMFMTTGALTVFVMRHVLGGAS